MVVGRRYIAANYPIEVVRGSRTGHSAINGPTRFVRGTARTRQPPPTLEEEPDWMRYATLNPLPAGSVLLRDIRTWHGGTPNVSDEVRAIPQASFCPGWFRMRCEPSMPEEVFASLSEHGQAICQDLRAPAGAKITALFQGEDSYPQAKPRL